METGKTTTCPLCGQEVARLIYHFHRGEEDVVLRRIRELHPDWIVQQGACSRCVDYYHIEVLQKKKLLPEVGPHFPVRMPDDYVVIPTPLRMTADPEYTGKGVAICMIDSGFYPHPDLIKPANRILHSEDIAAPSHKEYYFRQPHDDSWHGTMTTVVCAGNGYLSKGLYKGIASQARLVLLKVKNERGISTQNITEAIRWAIRHREEFNIRIINLSLGDDWPESYQSSPVDQAAEDAIKVGIVVVAAVGNDPNQPIKPPANSPNVIAVGGVDDHNTLGFMEESLYHSTFGTTIDRLSKPELIAPAIWIAAPILPGTPEQAEAQALFKMIHTRDRYFRRVFEKEIAKTGLEPLLATETSATVIKEKIKEWISRAKYISPHYMHVEGTSFASPITASIIAQMLEANPTLTPKIIREILLTTARKLPHLAAERQGHGVVNARLALRKAETESHIFPVERQESPVIDYEKKAIIFYFHDHDARSVALVGDFNRWSAEGSIFKKEKMGGWTIKIPLLPKGSYAYKFLINGEYWISDPRNPQREPDGFNGFNSKFMID